MSRIFRGTILDKFAAKPSGFLLDGVVSVVYQRCPIMFLGFVFVNLFPGGGGGRELQIIHALCYTLM